MNLTAVTMVKDELDVLPYTLAQLAHQGVDQFVIADNMSTDGTWEWLEAWDPGVPVILKRDEDPAYYQSAKMSALADYARKVGATWVLPFDADECWYSTESTIRTELEESGPDIKAAVIRNYYATSNDYDDRNPFVRIRHHDVEYLTLPKVMVPALPGVVIHQGNHGATLDGRKPYYVRSQIEIGHFPYRSFEQFVRKVRNGAAAYAASDLPESMGEHWRGYGRVLETGGEEALYANVWSKWFFDPPVSLVDDPVPYLA